MTDFIQDLRYGVRNLLRAPGFTIAAVLALALGVGATTAIFSLVNGVVLKPLPYADPARLVTVWEANHERSLDHEPISPVNFLDYRALGHVFTDAAAWWRPEITLRGEDREPIRVNTIEVSGNFTSVMGVTPGLGAGFPEGEFHSRDLIALISHRLWRTRFGSDPAVIGQPIVLNESTYRIAGVMPAGFHFPGDTDVWQRLNWDLARHSRGAHFMEAVARLAPGMRVSDAQRELDALTARLGREFTATNGGWSARAIALHDEVVGYYRPALVVLLAAVGLLLLIACINVASLLLARASSRAREVAVRAAIGATRARLLRQFLTESLLLAAMAGLLGVGLAVAATKLLVAATPMEIPRMDEVGIDARVLVFASAIAACTALLFGLLPALFLSRPDLQAVLTDGGRSASGGRGRRHAHRVLVASEVGLAVLLLAGAGLLLRSVDRLAAEDPGVRPAGVVTAGIQLAGAAYREWPQVEQFHSTLVRTLAEQPGVTAAGAGNFLPLAPGWRVPFLIRGLPPPTRGDEPTAQYISVSEGYFEAMGVALRRGRFFDDRDTAASRGVVIVNEALARRYFPGEDPVGRTVTSMATRIGPLGASLMKEREHLIVGVVADVKNSSLQAATEPALYHPLRQFPFRHVYLVARGEDTAAVGTAIRDSIRRLDPAQAMPDLRPLTAVVGEAIERPRFLMFLMSVFAAAALALSALGIYALLSYTVSDRYQELSIRLALGARPAGLLWLVLRQGLTLALAGAAIGMFAAYAAGRRLESLLYQVAPGDPATLAGVATVALLTAVVACSFPAWRASRLDPLAGLRE